MTRHKLPKSTILAKLSASRGFHTKIATTASAWMPNVWHRPRNSGLGKRLGRDLLASTLMLNFSPRLGSRSNFSPRSRPRVKGRGRGQNVEAGAYATRSKPMRRVWSQYFGFDQGQNVKAEDTLRGRSQDWGQYFGLDAEVEAKDYLSHITVNT